VVSALRDVKNPQFVLDGEISPIVRAEATGARASLPRTGRLSGGSSRSWSLKWRLSNGPATACCDMRSFVGVRDDKKATAVRRESY
jgi:hypothetical protein